MNNPKKSYIQVAQTGSLYYEDGKLKTEKTKALKQMKFLYFTFLGKLISPLIKNRYIAKIFAIWQDSGLSKSAIKSFIKEYAIDMSSFEVPIDEYRSFNDFFIRKLKPDARSIDMNPMHVVSPCDGKVLVLPDLTIQAEFFVKGNPFNVQRLLKNKSWAQKYEHGTALVFRLAPYDYHRCHFPMQGIPSIPNVIHGAHESVNPLVFHAGVEPFTHNERHSVMLETKQFGTVAIVLVGALFVSRIVHTFVPDVRVEKADEIGYFSFGGSSIILLFEPGLINCRPDLEKHSYAGYQTAVKMGEYIAEKQRP